MSEEAIAESVSRHRIRPHGSASPSAGGSTTAEARLRDSRMRTSPGPQHRRRLFAVNGSSAAASNSDVTSYDTINHSSSLARRNLRLRRGSQGSGFSYDMMAQYSTLQFSRKIAVESITSRLSMLESAVGTCSPQRDRSALCDPDGVRSSKLTSANIKRLVYLDSRLSRFGYRLLCPPQSLEAVSRLMAPRDRGVPAAKMKPIIASPDSSEPMCYLSYLSAGTSGENRYRGAGGGIQDAFKKWLL
jgi:hypothetical protein